MRYLDMLLGICPNCRKGNIFRDGLAGLAGAMNPECPSCGISFLREAGYFLGAMYVSYGLGVFTVLPVAMILTVGADLPLWEVMLVAVVQTLISVPLFLRLSRSIWLHLDQALDPR